MAHELGLVSHKSWGLYAIKFCERPFILQTGKACLLHTSPHFMSYFGGIVFAFVRCAGCRNYFRLSLELSRENRTQMLGPLLQAPNFPKNSATFPTLNWLLIEFFRGRPRGGDNFTSHFQVLQTLYSKRQKQPFLPLRVATPSGAPRQAPLEPLQRVHGQHLSEDVCQLRIFRAARVQNEFAPEKFLNRYEKRFEKREKGSEKRSETRLKKI